ncbi:hypothetical protein D8I35_09555 [Corticibacter populi]|uniref:Uncharacterized protein n=1 Tax=Corticibacter populi TaxID=1550736 RepID=A0A3M6QUN1_9BURK|nr:hypothetical protein [Corticibacter populi]RMX06737.1 hypothetical protein D8I35_09555 [Corticibacter populi]RZS31680.1 hypothetical protein EV687_2349 [Corticibacter populi]
MTIQIWPGIPQTIAGTVLALAMGASHYLDAEPTPPQQEATPMHEATPTQPAPHIALTGTLSADAVVRIQPIGELGKPMHVLQLQIHGIGPAGATATLQQVFPPHNPAAPHARAAQLRKGTRVRFVASAEHLHLNIPLVESISIVKEEAV